ncbi:MAG TPA: winged helix-turn-helix domain-containing protein, partial [Xanthomonadaceae bacterium]|nr:winged helix-turn-helix domain-containing protein [Xanthomonadaceae bacterium]
MSQYRFNGIFLDPGTRRIRGPQGSVHLPPKPYGVLVELLQDPDSVVTREELLERVWPERPASDETLSRAVADLRKLLGDDSRAPRYIGTVPKLGYRILSQVESVEVPTPKHRRWVAAFVAAILLAVVSALVFRPARSPADSTGVAGSGLAGPALPLTTEIGDEDTPGFSPDGRYLVYAARASGDENWDIRLRELATGTVVDLVAGPDREYAPAFSPDGTRVAFLRYRGEHCQVVIKALAGGERQVAECRTPMMGYLDWSPDGRRIVYSDDPGQGEATMVLRTVDLETGAVEAVVAAPPAHQYQFAPRFAPDGRQLVYVQGGLERNELWLADLPQGPARPVTTLGGRITGVSWNGDGSALYFSTALPAESALWRLVPGAQPQRIHDAEAYTPAFDAVSGRLVFDQVRARTNIWSLPLQAGAARGEPVRVIVSTRADHRPGISPDGTQLAFVSDRSGYAEVWLAAADGSGPRRATDWRAAAISRPAWSPDGRNLAYAVLREGRWHGYLDPLDGTVRQRLPTPEAREMRHPVWSQDGSWILYAADTGIHRISIDGRRDEPVLAQPGAVPLFEHASALYFLHPGLLGVQRLGPDGVRKTLLDGFELVVPEAISIGGGHLF